MTHKNDVETESGSTGKGNRGGGAWNVVDGNRGKPAAKKSRNVGLNKGIPMDEENFPSLAAQAGEQQPPRSPVKKPGGKNNGVQLHSPQPSPQHGGARASVLDLEEPFERGLSPMGAKTLSFADGVKNGNEIEFSEEESMEGPTGSYTTGFVPPPQ